MSAGTESPWLVQLPAFIFNFCFLYPLFMSWVWNTGALHYWFRYEKHGSDPARPPRLDHFP